MEQAVFFITSVTIAALIGYVTNYLAIRMLFHPRKAWFIRGRRIPFTPGLIPKRRGEIAVALGRVVSEYLVTTDGLKEMLARRELQGQLEQTMKQWIKKWAENNETVEDMMVRLVGDKQAGQVKASIESFVREMITKGAVTLWMTDGAMHRPLKETIDKLQIPVAELVEREGSDRVITALRTELASPHGTKLVRDIVQRMLDGLGGMMGMLAGMFLDEDKIAVKVREALLSWLQTPVASERIGEVLKKQVDELVQKTPAELVVKLREIVESGQTASEGNEADRESVLSRYSGVGGGDVESEEYRISVDSRDSGKSVLSRHSGVSGGASEAVEGVGGIEGSGGASEVVEGVGGIEGSGGASEVVEGIGGIEGSGGASEVVEGTGGIEGSGGAPKVVEGVGTDGRAGEIEGSGLGMDSGAVDGTIFESGRYSDDAEWFAGYVGRLIPLDMWMNRLWLMTPREFLGGRTDWLMEQVPHMARFLIQTIADKIEHAVHAINLPKLVQKQVEQFPMEQAEQVILSITGREFRAITWLGALLGGVIGTVQAILYLLLGS